MKIEFISLINVIVFVYDRFTHGHDISWEEFPSLHSAFHFLYRVAPVAPEPSNGLWCRKNYLKDWCRILSHNSCHELSANTFSNIFKHGVCVWRTHKRPTWSSLNRSFAGLGPTVCERWHMTIREKACNTNTAQQNFYIFHLILDDTVKLCSCECPYPYISVDIRRSLTSGSVLVGFSTLPAWNGCWAIENFLTNLIY